MEGFLTSETVIWIIGGVAFAISFIFSLIEGALLFYSPTKLKELLKKKKDEPKRLYDVAERWESLYLLSRFLDHTANILLVMTVTYYWWHIEYISILARILAAAGCSLILVFVLAELIPDTIGRWAAERVLLTFSRPLLILNSLLQPITRAFFLFCRLMLALFGIKAKLYALEEAQEDILDALDEGERIGLIPQQERTMIEQVMALKEKTVIKVMTPRPFIVAISANSTVQDAQKLVTETGHSRIPVYEGKLDNILGLVVAKDLLKFIAEGKGKASVREALREPFFVPETKELTALLNEMKKRKTHLAIVVDEYGGTSGVVSLVDIVEEIIGKIEDEYPSPKKQILWIDSKTLLVDGTVSPEELGRFIGRNLKSPNNIGTLAGLLIEKLGRIPKKNETANIGGLSLSVADADARRVKKIKVILK